ncbi:MAG: hypothetical protein D3910_28905 [Candidatus Electrothrix sp. ATG2]|nr:hypothetical protein [Candidatus Electrothrix sp. ATG2]
MRRGVEIDYCPNCNGIWLDNGELNKIVAESIQVTATESSPAEISAEASRKSVFKSFLDLMGSTKDDAEDGWEDDSDDDFITSSNK